MIVLHAAAEDGQLLLWGESPAAQLDSATRSGKRRSRKAQAPAAVSPFDPGPERLAEALHDVVPTLAVGKNNHETRTAWLPTVGGGPLASSSLIAELPENGAKAELA